MPNRDRLGKESNVTLRAPGLPTLDNHRQSFWEIGILLSFSYGLQTCKCTHAHKKRIGGLHCELAAQQRCLNTHGKNKTHTHTFIFLFMDSYTHAQTYSYHDRPNRGHLGDHVEPHNHETCGPGSSHSVQVLREACCRTGMQAKTHQGLGLRV